MSIEVLMVKEKGRLVPAEPMSAESIDGIKEGETVTCSIKRPRNPAHHRKLFALLNAVYPHQQLYPTVQELLQGLKIATGLFECGKTVDGYPFMVVKSISFVSMDQHSFSQWYDRAVDIILTKILPAVNRADLEAEVNSILAGYAPEKHRIA